MKPLATILALLLPLAGCLGDAETPAATEGLPPDASPPPPESCPPEADCLVAPDPARAAPVSVPFSFEGSTGTGACPPIAAAAAAEAPTTAAPGAFGHCVFVQDARWDPPEVSVATPLRVVAELRAPESPAEQTFYVSLVVDEGDGWTWDPEREPGAEGVPPLSVDWDVSRYAPGTRFMFWVEAAGGAGPATLTVDQPYEVEGALVGLAPQ